MPKLIEIIDGPTMIDILWTIWEIEGENKISKDEARFLWEADPEFRAEIRLQYDQLIELVNQAKVMGLDFATL